MKTLKYSVTLLLSMVMAGAALATKRFPIHEGMGMMKRVISVLCLLGLMCTAVNAAKQPNILLVLFDDLGFSDLGCYGSEIRTPHIDSLAKKGLRYTGMTNSARCVPTRGSLLTGLHPGQAGLLNGSGKLVSDCVTLAEVLGNHGYSTYAVGKWHVGHLPTDRGFDEFYGYPGGHSQDQWIQKRYQRLPRGRKPELKYDDGEFYATDVFTDYAIEFMEQAEKKKKPWFLYLAHSSPHFPLQAPIESVKSFVPTYRKGWDVLREERFKKLKEIGLIDSDSWKLPPRSLVPTDKDVIANGFPGKPNPAWDSLDKDRQEDLAYRMAIFAAMVKHVDDGMGRIVEQLKKSGQYENTVIMVLSDNGACYEWGPFGFDVRSRAGKNTLREGKELDESGQPGTYMSYGSAWANLGNTPYRMYKHFAHQGGIVTPFIIHWPKIDEVNRWVRDPAHIIDLMPTVLQLSGAKYPKRYNDIDIQPMEGVSLVPTFLGKSLAPRTLCYYHQGARAVQRGKWKIVYTKKEPTPPKWELYDLEKDPCELDDLAEIHPEVMRELIKEYDEWAERALLEKYTGK